MGLLSHISKSSSVKKTSKKAGSGLLARAQNSTRKSFATFEDWANNYFSSNAYNENLRMISLSVLFGVDDGTQTMVKRNVIDNKVEDWLINFLLGDNQSDSELLFPSRFHTLKEVMASTNQIELLKRYLQNEWYNKDFDCFEAHKDKQKIYYGYWCFESGAIAKLLNLDDSILKDELYYPYDLVHFHG